MNTILAALLPHLLELGVTGFLAIAGFAAARLARLLGLSNDDKVRRPLLAMVEAVADAMQERLDRALRGATVEAPGREVFVAAVAAPIIESGADYIQQQMPGALRQLGVDREGVERMLRLRLGLHE